VAKRLAIDIAETRRNISARDTFVALSMKTRRNPSGKYRQRGDERLKICGEEMGKALLGVIAVSLAFLIALFVYAAFTRLKGSSDASEGDLAREMIDGIGNRIRRRPRWCCSPR